jgi:type I restriction enzyme S subunit
MSDTLQSISISIGSGITPSRKNPSYWDSKDFYWLKTEQIGEFEIYETSEYISQKAVNETNIKIWSPCTISVAMYGEGATRGKVSILMREMATNQACCNIVVNEKKADYRYVYYWLKNNYQYLRGLSTGIRKNLNADVIKNIPVSFPQIPRQNAISTLLSNIDRKIALNKDINVELEKTAKMLYNYWFVQFDFPNVDGKPYRASGGEMEYNEVLKKEIPKGWEVKPFGEMYEVLRGELITEKETNEGNIKVVAAGLEYSCLHSEFNREKNTITVSGSGANAGYVNLWHERIFASDCITVRGETDVDTFLAYHYLKFIQKVILKKATGSAQPHVYPNDIKEIQYCDIPSDLKEKISITLMSINDKIANLQKESAELIALRDFLLPLLMNGQVTVSMAESKTEQHIIATAKQPQAMSAAAKKAAVFKRLVLSAYILDNICDEPTAGRVKFEKLLYLSEHCAQLPLHSEFQRAAAGPYDAAALYSIEGQLCRNKWFKGKKATGGRIVYSRLAKVDGYRKYIDTKFDIVQKGMIDKLLRLLKHADTEQCEIVATLYGAWNDFLIDGVHPSDDQIVDEVLTNWNPSKVRIERNRWIAALTWMRQNDIVPVGYGISTK